MDETLSTHAIYRPGDVLTLNISPGLPDQFIGTLSISERMTEFTNDWIKRLKKLSGFKYRLYLEASRYGLLHWHGTLKVLDSLETANSLAIIKYKMNVRIEVDTIKDMRIWQQYIKKDQSVTKTSISNTSKPYNGVLGYLSKGDPIDKMYQFEAGVRLRGSEQKNSPSDPCPLNKSDEKDPGAT